jgi:hypothetical protein
MPILQLYYISAEWACNPRFYLWVLTYGQAEENEEAMTEECHFAIRRTCYGL